ATPLAAFCLAGTLARSSSRAWGSSGAVKRRRAVITGRLRCGLDRHHCTLELMPGPCAGDHRYCTARDVPSRTLPPTLPRQPHPEHASTPHLTLHLDLTTQRAGKVTANHQSEAGAAADSRVALVDLPEALEDAVEMLGGDSDSGVLDLQDDRALVRPGTELHV